jgi:hypothetical protein
MTNATPTQATPIIVQSSFGHIALGRAGIDPHRHADRDDVVIDGAVSS